ncbi:MAG: hypothetical protein NZ700_17590 [Gemmataceae bacterium]|nr:hypothetical protein [Gemmataceae bacterium]MDW8266137.1 hypothetical protein [Gemmataceae bacterium]
MATTALPPATKAETAPPQPTPGHDQLPEVMGDQSMFAFLMACWVLIWLLGVMAVAARGG